MAAKKILVVDDDEGVREFIADWLEDRGFDVETAKDGEDGLEKFKAGSYDLVMSDMLMPRMIGIELLRRIKEVKPDQMVVLLTGVKEDTMVEKAKQLGCRLYINKPVRLEDLEKRILECFPDHTFPE